MKTLLWLSAALVLVVCTASAALRLSQAGVGCSPWPACYLQQAATPETQAASAPAWHERVRLTHRISASVVGLMFVFAALFGWARWNAGERIAGAGLLLASLALAWLGRYTPSPLPAVALANLVGGHVLLAMLAWLLTTSGTETAPRSGAAVAFGFVAVVAVQIALGGLVSARAAAAACIEGCIPGALSGWTLSAFDLGLANSGLGSPDVDSIERRAVLVAHEGAALVVLGAAAFAGWRARHALRWKAWLPLALTLVAAALGLKMARGPYPLGQAVVHSVTAALALAGATALWRLALRRPDPRDA
jgi:cytochrome c oxidase assembly protein subunit 15